MIKRIIVPLIDKKFLLKCAGTNLLNSVGNSTVSGDADKLSSATSQNHKTVQLSDSCVKKLEKICEDGSFLRVSVEGGGCSGFQYKFDLDTKLNEDDISFGNKNAKIVIDTISLDYCSGSTIDYHSELIRSGFRVINNPNAQHGCSCGASFTMKLD